MMKLIKKLLWLMLVGLLILGSIAVGYYLAVTKDVSLNPEKLILNENNLLVYDQNGEQIENVSAFAIKQTVKLENIPLHTQLAFVNTEDKRFYKHDGFDVKRIVKAAWNNVKARSFKEGASTISQQLIKNTHLSQEKTVKRKLKEWKLTKQLEKKYSKEEILEKYLNSIYFGHNCFGIRAAAEFYFGKTPEELNLADSAILAGLVKSPNNYSPFKNPEQCAKRKESVLLAMMKNESITQEEKNEAMNTPLPLPYEHSTRNIGYLSFVFDELSALVEEKNLTLGGKIEIFTTLNPNLQAELEKIAKENTNCDKSMMVLDPATGNFKACFSTVGNIRRLPGSLIKPLLVYTPAIEEDILVPATPILDEKINYSGYAPENYDGKFNGYVSARECVAKSLNIPAVKVFQSLGIKKGVTYLEKLGLKTEEDDRSLALALGGMKNGFTLRDMATAYSSLQDGNIKNCGFITKIKLNEVPVYTRTQKAARVFSEDSAYLMTDMLKTAAKSGTAKKLRALPFEVAAKTGTVGTKSGNTDAYALSYTTRDLVAVWLGNADNSAIEYTGGGMPCNFLLSINEYLCEQYKKEGSDIPNFTIPNGIKKVTLDKTSYYDTHNILLADDFAPSEYRFEELFKTKALPSKKSDFFSNPSISPPTLQLKNNKVLISFDRYCPTIYTYKIDRYDYATHTTVYHGDYIDTFTDDDLQKNKKYIYTVTPIYNGRMGTSITLPIVNTSPSSELNNEEILDKNWWEY